MPRSEEVTEPCLRNGDDEERNEDDIELQILNVQQQQVGQSEHAVSSDSGEDASLEVKEKDEVDDGMATWLTISKGLRAS